MQTTAKKRPYWAIRAEWKPGMKDVDGDPLVGGCIVWTGRVKRKAEEALEEMRTSKAKFFTDHRRDMENFRIADLNAK